MVDIQTKGQIMADYAERLLSIKEKQQKLLAEEAKLVEKRKVEIGALAEKFGLLTVSDEFLSGLFQDAKNAIVKKTDKVQEWEKLGGQISKPRNDKPAKTKNAKHAETA